MASFIDVPRLNLRRVFPYTRQGARPPLAPLARWRQKIGRCSNRDGAHPRLCTGRGSLEPVRIRQRERVTSSRFGAAADRKQTPGSEKRGRLGCAVLPVCDQSTSICVSATNRPLSAEWKGGGGGPPAGRLVPFPGEVGAHFLEKSQLASFLRSKCPAERRRASSTLWGATGAAINEALPERCRLRADGTICPSKELWKTAKWPYARAKNWGYVALFRR
jgi:hypothetical protein